MVVGPRDILPDLVKLGHAEFHRLLQIGSQPPDRARFQNVENFDVISLSPLLEVAENITVPMQVNTAARRARPGVPTGDLGQ